VRRAGPLGWLLSLWLLVLACRPPEPAGVPLLDFGEDTPTNLLWLSVDTLRRDTVGRYAGTGDTPFVDGLLAQGVALDDHGGCSNWTAPSFHCLYTGARPLELGFVVESGDDAVPGSPRRLDTLPEALAEAGFTGRLVTSNPYLEPSSSWPLGQGFETVSAKPFASGTVVTDAGLALAEGLTEPWFLQVHYLDPHEPYEAPEAFRDPAEPIAYDLNDPEQIRQLEADWFSLSDADKLAVQAWATAEYRAEVRSWDHELSRLWDGLDELGMLDDTLVLVVSDHGQQHLERGRWAHGHHLHVEEAAALAGFWAPGLTPTVWSEPTTHQDLAVTLATLYGLSLPDATGLAVGEAPADRARTMFHFRLTDTGADGVPRHSVEADRWRLSYNWDGALRLHDRLADPAEANDLIETADPAEVDALWALLAPDLAAAQALFPHLEAQGQWSR